MMHYEIYHVLLWYRDINFFALSVSSTAFRRSGSSIFSCLICFILCGLSFIPSRGVNSVRQSMETVFDIPSLWILTVCGWTPNTLYSPDTLA